VVLEISESDATKCASAMLDLVAGMCDGQNKELQNILRKQYRAFQNVNVIGEVAVLLQTLAGQYHNYEIYLMQKAIQALIEMCAGNFTNQKVAFKNHIVESINIILQKSSSLIVK
jgi:inositol 1,4,5-triphosphate receptor type 1